MKVLGCFMIHGLLQGDTMDDTEPAKNMMLRAKIYQNAIGLICLLKQMKNTETDFFYFWRKSKGEFYFQPMETGTQ